MAAPSERWWNQPELWLEIFAILNIGFLTFDIYLAHSVNQFAQPRGIYPAAVFSHGAVRPYSCADPKEAPPKSLEDPWAPCRLVGDSGRADGRDLAPRKQLFYERTIRSLQVDGSRRKRIFFRYRVGTGRCERARHWLPLRSIAHASVAVVCRHQRRGFDPRGWRRPLGLCVTYARQSSGAFGSRVRQFHLRGSADGPTAVPQSDGPRYYRPVATKEKRCIPVISASKLATMSLGKGSQSAIKAMGNRFAGRLVINFQQRRYSPSGIPDIYFSALRQSVYSLDR